MVRILLLGLSLALLMALLSTVGAFADGWPPL